MKAMDYIAFRDELDKDLLIHEEDDGYVYFLYEDPAKGSMLFKDSDKYLLIIDIDLRDISEDKVKEILKKHCLNKPFKKYTEPEEYKLEFKSLELSDMAIIRKYIDEFSFSVLCDHTIGGVFMWRVFYNMDYAIDENNDALYIRIYTKDRNKYYMLPLAYDIEKAIDNIIDYELKENDYIRFAAIPKEYIGYITDRNYNTMEMRTDYFDYLYEISLVKNLKGKRYHKIRNHINKFISTYNYHVEPMTERHVDSVIKFFQDKFIGSNKLEAIEENVRTLEVLQNFDLFNFKGIVLYVDDNIVGFCLGEERNDVLYDHIEKADKSYDGIYQILFHEFLLAYGQDAFYVNKEEDMGDEGLRQAKLAYQPDLLESKFTIIIYG